MLNTIQKCYITQNSVIQYLQRRAQAIYTMLNNMSYADYITQKSYITQTDDIYHVIRKKAYNKNICYITYILFNILINIYNNMLYIIYGL